MSDLTLAGFLAARLDEDERIALEAYADGPGAGMISVPRATAALIARHDPARVLREVEAGRKILAAWQDNQLERGDFASYADGLADGLGLAVRYLVTIYSDHPDCGEEWKP